MQSKTARDQCGVRDHTILASSLPSGRQLGARDEIEVIADAAAGVENRDPAAVGQITDERGREVPLLPARRFTQARLADVQEPVAPAAFAVPAAYGDLLAALLALLAIVGLRGRWRIATILVWLFSIAGTVDLLNALYQGMRLGVQLGAAYYIPTFAVPALLVTHAMIFVMLVTRAR